MAQMHDREDETLDRNLRRIGAELHLPSPPSPQTQNSWKSSTASRAAEVIAFPQPQSLGAKLMRNPRFLTLAGSAAASVAIGGFLWLSAAHNTVQASTILNSFRERLFQGFHVTMRNIGAEGVHVDGEFHARFKPFDLANPPKPEDADVEAVAFDMNVKADESADEIGGLRLHVAGAGDDQSQWMFIQADSIPSQLVEDEPMAAVAMQFLNNGILLDLNGIFDLLNEAVPDLVTDLSIFGDEDTPDATSDNKTVKVSVDMGAKQTDADHLASAKTAVSIDWNNPSEEQIQQFAQDFLLGRAGPEHIEAIVQLIQQAARDVTVRETEPGLYILRASDFTISVDESDEDIEMLKRMVVEIAYRRDHGVEYANIANIGEYNGELRLSFADEQIDPKLFDRERFLEQGGVTVLNLAALKPLIEAAIREEAE